MKTPRRFLVLLALFPREFTDAFGGEMKEVFAAQLLDARRRGFAAVVWLWIRTATGMMSAAWRERSGTGAPRRARLPWYETLATDLRLAVRTLRRARLLAAVVVGTIAVGIGGVATIFSALNARVARPRAARRPGVTGRGDARFPLNHRDRGIRRASVRAASPATGRLSPSTVPRRS